MKVINLSNTSHAERVDHLKKGAVIHFIIDALELKDYPNLLIRCAKVILF